MQETDPSTRELARRAHDGDSSAFADLYSRLSAPLTAWARVRIDAGLRTTVEPDDVLHEVCFRAYRGFDSYDPDRATFRSWLFGMANNVLLEFFRDAVPRGKAEGATHRLDELPAPVSEASMRMVRRDDVRMFVEAARKLTDADRRYLIHRGLEGNSHARVGEILGVSAHAAGKHWQRVLVKLSELKLPEDFLVT